MKRNIVLDSCRTDIDSLVADAVNCTKEFGLQSKNIESQPKLRRLPPYLTIKMK